MIDTISVQQELYKHLTDEWAEGKHLYSNWCSCSTTVDKEAASLNCTWKPEEIGHDPNVTWQN